MTPLQKALCALILFSAWAAMVFVGLAPANDFITAIRDTLIALGTFQATITTPKD